MKDANVVCRMLGMGNATAATVRAKYGQTVGEVWMDDVNCTGKNELNTVESSERKSVISLPEVKGALSLYFGNFIKS